MNEGTVVAIAVTDDEAELLAYIVEDNPEYGRYGESLTSTLARRIHDALPVVEAS